MHCGMTNVRWDSPGFVLGNFFKNDSKTAFVLKISLIKVDFFWQFGKIILISRIAWLWILKWCLLKKINQFTKIWHKLFFFFNIYLFSIKQIVYTCPKKIIITLFLMSFLKICMKKTTLCWFPLLYKVLATTTMEKGSNKKNRNGLLVSLPVLRKYQLGVISNLMLLPIECYSKFSVTQNSVLLKIQCYSQISVTPISVLHPI